MSAEIVNKAHLGPSFDKQINVRHYKTKRIETRISNG